MKESGFVLNVDKYMIEIFMQRIIYFVGASTNWGVEVRPIRQLSKGKPRYSPKNPTSFSCGSMSIFDSIFQLLIYQEVQKHKIDDSEIINANIRTKQQFKYRITDSDTIFIDDSLSLSNNKLLIDTVYK